MNIHQLAQRIPKKLRDEILQENYIANAVSIVDNVYMQYLWTVWYEYVDVDNTQDYTCGYCRATVIDNFTALLPAIIELHKKEKLLEQL